MDRAAAGADDRHMILRRRSILGRRVSDPLGQPVGTVVDTWPFDGGGEVELAVVRLGRMGERRMLPVATLHSDGYELRTPYATWQVEDSPPLEDGRHALEATERAMSYWMWEEPADSLRALWPSFGFFATGRRSRTRPSPTAIES
jgi:hypothetical protein